MKDFFRHNGILILIAAILLALVTAVVSMLFGGVADPLSNLVGIVTTPVRNGITAVTNWAEEKYNDAFELEQMKEELAGLKQRNAELEAQAREAEAALQENERLRNLLELQPKEWSCDKAAAMVTARSTSNWESTLTIGKGSAAGIAVDDCVVDEYWNLVGVVAEVGENWATVRTLVDSDTEMGGQLARTGGAAILEGDFALMGEGRLKLTYLPENSELIAGDLVTTSGRGGVYPAGLVAGHVEEVRTDPSGMTRYAVVAPDVDLEQLVDSKVFREDLFYRINVFRINIPSLRERTGDVRQLAGFFLAKYSDIRPGGRVEGFTAEALAMMEAYPWPGNVRQLENSVERAVYLAEGELVTAAELPPEVRAFQGSAPSPAVPAAEGESPSGGEGEDEAARIQDMLHRTHGNVMEAARLLGISRRTLYRKLQRYHIDYSSHRI